MTQMIHNYSPEEARALEGHLLAVMQRDPAAKGKKLPPKMYESENPGGTPSRAEASKMRPKVLEVITKRGPISRADIRAAIPELNDSTLGNHLGQLQAARKIKHPQTAPRKWVAT